jgi:large subunit ribosomal protein L21
MEKNNFAVIFTGGKQYIVHEGQDLVVDKLEVDESGKVVFDKVLLYADKKNNITLGRPYIAKATVSAELVKQDQGEKIRVARFKAKSKYRRVTGFRQQLTQVKIVALNVTK